MLGSVSRIDQTPRVLFVDDSRLMRYAGQQFLSSKYDVITAENGREAWQKLQSDPRISLVFTDLMMPVMDGTALIRQIRGCEEPRIRDLPLFVVTGTDEAAASQLALRQGATDVIQKPFSSSDLNGVAAAHTRTAPPQPPRPGTGEASPARTPRQPAPRTTHERQQHPGYFLKRLDQALSFHDRHGLQLALIHVRLNDFERIYFELGQRWAEAVLRNIGRVLDEQVRTEDTVCRSHMASFSLILMATDRSGAWILANRLRRLLNGARVRFPTTTLRISVSVAVQMPNNQGTKSPRRLLHEGMAQFDQQTLAGDCP